MQTIRATRPGAIHLSVGLIMLGLLAAGCADEQAGSSADCTAQIRLDGTTYSGYGTSDHRATEHAVADVAECHDVGADAEGSVFPDDADTLPVSAFDGYSPEDVLGVPSGSRTYTVFVAESLSPGERDRVLEGLSTDGN